MSFPNKVSAAPAQAADDNLSELSTSTRVVRRRDQAVVCASCGKRVARKSRGQIYCSTRCRKRGHYGEIVRRGGFNPTSESSGPLGTNPLKKANKDNVLRTQKTWSNPRINVAPRIVIEAEVFEGRIRRAVTSADGVAVQVAGSAVS